MGHRKPGRSLAIPALGAVALLLSSCATVRQSQKPVGPIDSPLLKYGQQLFLAGDFQAASQVFSDVIIITSDKDLAAEALYWRGLSYIKTSRFSEAETDFLACIDRTRDPDLTAKATMGLGDSLLAQARFQDASKVFSTILQHHAQYVRKDEALYKTALTYIRAGQPAAAIPYLEDVSANFPDSIFAELAKDVLANTSTGMSLQLGAFRDHSAADAFVSALRAKGVDAEAVPVTRNGSPLFAVRHGRFASWDQAMSAAAALRSKGIEGIVFP